MGEHVNKVIEILGRDNIALSGKQIKQIIDLIGKEEMLEVEGKIEKILGKMPIVEVDKTVMAVKEKIKEMNSSEKDLTESLSDNVMEDKAVDLSDEKVEQHIAELFSRPSEHKKDESARPL